MLQSIKVALSGDGSDEIMYGYPYNSFYNRNKRLLENNYFHSFIKKFPIYNVKQFSLLSRTKSRIDGKPNNIYDILSAKIVKNKNSYIPKAYENLFDYDFNNYLPNNILCKTDRMSV